MSVPAPIVRRLVIGIGNPDRGDDGVGHEVVRLLEDRVPAGVKLVRHIGEATALLDCMQDADAVYLIDAAASGAGPGTIYRLGAAAGPLPSELCELSSHGFGLQHAIELARALGTLPERSIVYAIEGQRFDAGAPLTPVAARAAQEVARRVLGELRGRRLEPPTAR